MKLPTTKILPTYRGLDKEGTGQIEYGIYSREYIIPPNILMYLEMQEADLARKLVNMYSRKMNLDKSTFFKLRFMPRYSDFESDENSSDYESSDENSS